MTAALLAVDGERHGLFYMIRGCMMGKQLKISIDKKGFETYFAAMGQICYSIHKVLSKQKNTRIVIDYNPGESKVKIDVDSLED